MPVATLVTDSMMDWVLVCMFDQLVRSGSLGHNFSNASWRLRCRSESSLGAIGGLDFR